MGVNDDALAQALLFYPRIGNRLGAGIRGLDAGPGDLREALMPTALLTQTVPVMGPEATTVIVGLVSLLGIAVLVLTSVAKWREIFRPAQPVPPAVVVAPPPSPSLMDRPVTQAEMLAAVGRVEGSLSKHETYTHTRLHELAGSVNALVLKVELQPARFRETLDAVLAPLIGKVEEAARSMVGLEARLQAMHYPALRGDGTGCQLGEKN